LSEGVDAQAVVKPVAGVAVYAVVIPGVASHVVFRSCESCGDRQFLVNGLSETEAFPFLLYQVPDRWCSRQNR
jgi:hypothetical protein